MGQTAKNGKTFGISTKLLYVVIAAGVFLVLALTKTTEFTPGQTMTFILTIAGFGVAGHTLTDVASMFRRFQPIPIEDLAEPVRREDRVTPVETPVPRRIKEDESRRD